MSHQFSRRDFLRLSGLTALGLLLMSCERKNKENPLTTGINTSPFGIYSPWGEFGLDRGTFASQDDITGHLRDIGVKWVQELPSFLALDIVPEDINLYSRIGREAGMVPALIRDSDTVKRFKDELEQTITNGLNRFKYLEVDTEPDGLGGWQNDPEGYVQLLKLCYESVKKISPNCQIMFGGLSGGDALLDNQGTTFLEKVLAAGGAAYFDGLAFKRHHLGVLDYAQIKTHFESIAGILANYGLDIHQMPVFVEAAMYDGDPNDPVPHPFSPNLPVQTETDQASGLVKSYIYAIALGVDKIFWNLVYERSDFEPGHAIPFPQNPFNHYGLIHNPTNSDGFSHRKLAYYSYKKMVAVLDGSDWATVESVQASENIFIFKFIKNGKPLYAAWWDYFQDSAYHPGDTKEIILSNLEAPSARIINAVPNVASGDLVSDYSAAFNEKVMPIKDGALTLSLGEIPVFIEA